ncbi:hypothetical protein MARINOS108_110122 [Marinoscillum sp. 108]|nr:hypothetical protein MARINOS108_110122 [Marinoscillum sp. 108]
MVSPLRTVIPAQAGISFSQGSRFAGGIVLLFNGVQSDNAWLVTQPPPSDNAQRHFAVKMSAKIRITMPDSV